MSHDLSTDSSHEREKKEQKDSHFHSRDYRNAFVLLKNSMYFCKERKKDACPKWHILLQISALVYARLWVNKTIQRYSEISMYYLFIYLKYIIYLHILFPKLL